MNTIIYKSSPIQKLVDADEKAGVVKGYGSIFDNLDSDGDIIKKGSYKKTIKENGSRVKYLYQHSMDKPLGKITTLQEDKKGLLFEAEIPKTQLGKEVILLMKSGIINENSVGILPIQKEYNGENREITEVKLFEISAVTLAANDQANIIDVKGKNIDSEQIIKRYDSLIKIIRKGDISDDLGYAIESELYKLKSFYLNATVPNIEVTQPKEVKETNDSEILKYIINNLKKS